MAQVHRNVSPMPPPGSPFTPSALDRYKDTVKDYNFGSLIRTDATGEYSETNTIFSMFTPLLACGHRLISQI